MKPIQLMRYRSVASIQPPASDPYWNSVVSLLHFDGLPGSTTFIDVKGKTWVTGSGSPKLSSMEGTFRSGQSLSIPTDNSYIRTSSSLDFEFPGDFTIEFDFYPTSSSTTHRAAIGGNIQGSFQIGTRNGKMAWWINNSGGINETELTVALNTRSHFALWRSGGVIKSAINGVVSSLNVNNTNLFPASDVQTGYISSTYTLPGYMDELRITKGVARYSSNFSPPNTPFPDG